MEYTTEEIHYRFIYTYAITQNDKLIVRTNKLQLLSEEKNVYYL